MRPGTRTAIVDVAVGVVAVGVVAIQGEDRELG